MTNKFFKIDATTILHLGRDSIKDHATALIELVKNSYDADAMNVELEIMVNASTPYIRIADDGCGMDEDEIDQNWLKIGFSQKRSVKISKRGRRKTGEKGIGRISADRLGALMSVKTKTRSGNGFGLEINWDQFDRAGLELGAVPINFEKNINVQTTEKGERNSGTEIVITNLRQSWTKSDITKLYYELSLLIPPFRGVKDFDIYLKTDIAEEFNGKVQSDLYQDALIQLDAKFDGKRTLSYSVVSHLDKSKKLQGKQTIDWEKLVQKIFDPSNLVAEHNPTCGPIDVSLLFYLREGKSVLDSDLRLTDLRAFLDNNVGVKIYRDDIRVKPYGTPNETHGDWLGLAERKTREPAGIGRSTWKVSANQLVGAVYISRDRNPFLMDSSSREGLIETNAFFDLRSLVLGCVHLLENYRYELNKKLESKLKKPAEDELREYKKEVDDIEKNIEKIKNIVQDPASPEIADALERVEFLREKEQFFRGLVDENRVLRGLATIGISAAVFGHETQSSIAQFKAATNTAKAILVKDKTKVKAAIEELAKAQKYAKNVSAWGAFALARVQREKREKKLCNVNEVVENVLNEIEPAIRAGTIELSRNLEPVEAEISPMDIETILLNFITNAYHACFNSTRNRKIHVSLTKTSKGDDHGFEISVADSGPGISAKLKDQIWEPLFTTKHGKDGKETGTGLGLTIVQSISEEMKGEISVAKDADLKGARFTVWLPKK